MGPLRIVHVAGLAVAAVVFAGCATMRVNSFIERGTNFTVYRTYRLGTCRPAGDRRPSSRQQ